MLAAADVNPQRLESGKTRKRGRSTPVKEQRADVVDEPLDEKAIAGMREFLEREESAVRVRAKEILNKDLISLAEAFTSLEERLDDFGTYQDALDGGFVAEVRAKLSKTYRVGVKLEAWVQSFAPPLSAGGNDGVSGEVQDGIYSNIHGLTVGCTEALHRSLAFEKEYAIQRTKITDDAVWQRFRATLEVSMLHDVTKSILSAQTDLMSVMNTVANNLQHLRSAGASDNTHSALMY